MTTRTKSLALILAAVGLAVGLAASPASATVVPFPTNPTCPAPKACLEKTQYLTSTPNVTMPESCASRPITLIADRYDWELYIGDSGKDFGQDIAAGTYTWTTCLVPLTGNYDLFSELGNANHYYSVDWNGTNVPEGSGTYTWGTSLYPLG